MTEKQFRDWLKSYGRAWEECDPDAAAALFSDDAEYYETPFGAPCLGREGVREYWLGATRSQRDISFTHQILSLLSGRRRRYVRWPDSSGQRDGPFSLRYRT